MNPFLDLLLIQFIIVVLIDYSGAIEDFLTPIVKKLTGSKIGHIGKPFSCSFCMNFWTGLIYLLIVGQCNLFTLAYVLLLSVLTPITGYLIHFLIDFLTDVFEGLYRWFNL